MQQTLLLSHIITLLLPLVGAVTISKRAVDRGTFELQCKGGEGACNNAAYYINCIAKGDNKVTYLGANKKQNDQNRIESGCRASLRQESSSGSMTGTSTSVCQQFPYGMKFIPAPDRLDQTKAEDYQCDEWPPASADQPEFAKKKDKNSLRCMKSSENLKLGTQLGQIYGGSTANTAGKKAKMSAGDYFKVTFNTKGADMSKLQYVKTPNSCKNDGMQFQMTKRPNKGGLISAGNPSDKDNQYTLHGKTEPVGMCSIELHRESDKEFTNICVTDETNTDCKKGGKATITSPTGSHDVSGLSQGTVRMTRTGGQGTKIKFKFSDIEWDTTSTGTGKGPGGSKGKSTHTWCRELDGTNKPKSGSKAGTSAPTKYKEYQCYFPC